MFRYFKYLVVVTIFVSLIALSIPSPSHAAPVFADTPYDLINAVNALRASNGLPAYSISSILMFTAQNQADFMAITGNVTHTGAGGSSMTSRILAAGYPLAGDLSLGGFRSENITAGSENMSAQDAVSQWMGDAPHQNTMLSPNLTEIGAGVAVIDGRVYYVIDCAQPTTSGAPQAVTQAVEGGSAVPAEGGGVIYPVVVSTPNPNGDVIHEVKSGQSLWQIAIDYGVKIDDIKRLNNLFDNNIYPGGKLLIKKVAVLPTASATEVPTLEVTSSPTMSPSATAILVQVTSTFLPVPASSSSSNNNTTMGAVIGILAIALLGGGLFMWLGTARKE